MSHFMNTARNHFDAVASHVLGQLTGDEAVTLNLSAEDTLYVRFNANRVRQNTDVQQMVLALQSTAVLEVAVQVDMMSSTSSGGTRVFGLCFWLRRVWLLDGERRKGLRALQAFVHTSGRL